MMVPRDKLTKYNGITEGVTALSMLIAPSIAGYVMSSSTTASDQESALEHIFLFEFASFVAATVITLCFTTIPSPTTSSGFRRSSATTTATLRSPRYEAGVVLHSVSQGINLTATHPHQWSILRGHHSGSYDTCNPQHARVFSQDARDGADPLWPGCHGWDVLLGVHEAEAATTTPEAGGRSSYYYCVYASSSFVSLGDVERQSGVGVCLHSVVPSAVVWSRKNCDAHPVRGVHLYDGHDGLSRR